MHFMFNVFELTFVRPIKELLNIFVKASLITFEA